MRRNERTAALIGGIALLVCIIGAFFDATGFFRAYLFAWLFWLGIALGSIGILLMHVLTGGRWGVAVEAPLRAAARTIPLLAILFIPIAAAVRILYRWTNPAAREFLGNKLYLNLPFFAVRVLIYFAVWLGIVWYIERVRNRGAELSEGFASAALIAYVVTMTFASFDWIMSLEAHWWSTVFAMLVITGQGLAAIAFIVVARAVSERRGLRTDAEEAHRRLVYHDLGNLLLTFVMLWAYMAFSQFLVIWSGNLKEEIAWYLPRLHTSWRWLGLLLVLFYFAAPFLFLLFRGIKRAAFALGAVAMLILLMRFIDLYWTVEPSFHPQGAFLHWMDVLAPVGIGGLWVAAYIRNYAQRSELHA